MRAVNNFITLALCCLCMALTSCRSASTRVWVEDFNGSSLDTAVWSRIPRGNPEWCRNMSSDDRLYALEDGCLVLRAIVNPGLEGDDAPLLTGGIWTRGKKQFGLGRVEVRAKFEGAGGSWPAIWMMPDDEETEDLSDPFWAEYGWYSHYGEIDICEKLNFDDFAYQTLHTSYTLKQGYNDPYQEHGSTGGIDPEDFNVYAVEHYRDSIKMYINGVNTLTYKRIDFVPYGGEVTGREQWTFDRLFDLRLDMQVGGSWPGEPVLEDLPVKMWVDWVRFTPFEE